MESSSSDSFLWVDASNDSNATRKHENINPMESYEVESKSVVNYTEKDRNTTLESENGSEIKTKRKRSKKRKCSETTEDNSDHSQLKRKRIKLEQESDIDMERKGKLQEEHKIYNNDIQNSSLHYEEYLNSRVKEEETSLIQTKKRKKNKKTSICIDNACESNSAVELNKESYLDLRVKQEQTIVIEPEIVKSKKKNKSKKSIENSDMDITKEKKSVIMLSEATAQDISSDDEQTGCSIIEQKFCAEETVVEKPRKKKNKTETVPTYNSADDNESLNVKKKTRMHLEVDSDNYNTNDISLEPTDFTCNNIVSSTLIDNSAINLTDKPILKTQEFLGSCKNIHQTKISDRIRFEDDNSSQQEALFGRPSTKIDLFLKVNPHIKLYGSETPTDNLITKDDDIWTLTGAHEINLERLRNTTISPKGKYKIKSDGQTYEGFPVENIITITILTHEHRQLFFTKLPVKDSMNFHKRIPNIHIPDNNIIVNNQTNFIPLPETKYRHPLFGTHYKKAIKISKVVIKRLQAVKECCSETNSEKSNRKKHKKDKHRLVDIKVEQCLNIKPKSEPLKKHKKRRNSQDKSAAPKKPKYVKHNTGSPTAWESEKAIEENLFNF